MDAIPEALVLGLTLKTHRPEAALIAAIALGNLPEAISGSAGMEAAGRSVKWILGVWYCCCRHSSLDRCGLLRNRSLSQA